jgi:hypothetical protein
MMFLTADDDRPNLHVPMISRNREGFAVLERQVEIGFTPVALVTAFYEMHHHLASTPPNSEAYDPAGASDRGDRSSQRVAGAANTDRCSYVLSGSGSV